MVFGDVSEFAIEADFASADGKWLFGHLRLWVAGSLVGDFDETTDLASSARWGRQFLRASFKRTRPDLEASSAQDVYWNLYERFLRHGATDPGESWNRDPHVLDEVGESSLRDHVTVLVVRRSDGRDRVIVRDHDQELLREHVISPGSCDRVIDAYCAWVESLQA